MAEASAGITVGEVVVGERLGESRDAIQPGRRIATARGSAGLGVPLAFITPSTPLVCGQCGSSAWSTWTSPTVATSW